MEAKFPFPIHWSETVMVPIHNINSREHKFTDNETTLIGKTFKGLIVHTQGLSKTLDGRDIVPDIIAKKSTLTLVDSDGKNIIKGIPLETFYNTNGVFLVHLNNLKIDLRKSSILIQDNAGLNTNMAFVITFFYE